MTERTVDAGRGISLAHAEIGDGEPIVLVAGGAATVRAVAGARLATIARMGHDLPQGAWPTPLDPIDGHARPATARSTDASTTS